MKDWKITPGPWFLHHVEDDDEFEIYDNEQVGTVCGQIYSVANATAIAGLPDLIEAAEPIMKELREEELRYIEDDDELRDYHSVRISVAELRSLRSALLKCKGEAE
jgi:hypothetical protein